MNRPPPGEGRPAGGGQQALDHLRGRSGRPAGVREFRAVHEAGSGDGDGCRPHPVIRALGRAAVEHAATAPRPA
ncbi:MULTISPECIES: hypothetical protein [unclassified Streptomyces]|uniref:hypothetical protein n=1 Tax=unclassified Streptomyces TaxID=2593676 RepID=UPI002E29D757|nr:MULTISPECIES: hypothetical protein [unclassified Streptomyces]WUB86181.1 hypothetical protein OG812_06090 [Streptomyces sp. NBC_00566]